LHSNLSIAGKFIIADGIFKTSCTTKPGSWGKRDDNFTITLERPTGRLCDRKTIVAIEVREVENCWIR